MTSQNLSGRSTNTSAVRTVAVWLGCSVVTLGLAAPAFATGTVAGTDIDNVAEATYDTPSGPVTIQSNLVRIRVDELLDVTVTSTDPGDVTTSPGATGNVQTFRITNTGNGDEAFRLTANTGVGGDDFDPTLTQIVLDTNDNGVYDPGVDTVYVSGTNDPVLQPDESQVVFVITSTPVAVTNGNRGTTNLAAVAVTGSGAPGTTFAGAGQGGGNAVVGNTGADGDANGFLAVQAASLALVKSATIADPFGGNRPVPGAVITYSIVATISGAGSLNNLVITDPIPAATAYQVNSTTLEGAALTDATDADAGNYNGTRISVAAGNVPAGQTRTVTFRTVIQ
ncbi:MAG TPA: hypothetical protein VGN36_03835 [Sphingorhabdus sp.]|nr:hypothetical protein [Sphingorhabdus sp.]